MLPKAFTWAGRSLLKGRLSQQDPQHWVALDLGGGMGAGLGWALVLGSALNAPPGRGVRGGWDVWAWPGLVRTEVAGGPLRDEVARLSDLSRATRGSRTWAGTRPCWPGGQGSCPHSSLLDSHCLHLGFSGIFSCGALFCGNPHRSPRGPQGKQQLP